jgi:DnaK suppressor protein
MYLDHDQHRILLERKAEDLRRSLRQRSQLVIERTPECLEETAFAAEREAATTDLERNFRTLHQVEAALARLRAGSYGVCLKCEAGIADKRLNAVPWAIYCLKCQESVDRLHARVGAVRTTAA